MFRRLVFVIGGMVSMALLACSPAKPADSTTPENAGADHREIHVEKCDDTGQKDADGHPVCSEGCVFDPAAGACKVDRPIVIQCNDPRLHWDPVQNKCLPAP